MIRLRAVSLSLLALLTVGGAPALASHCEPGERCLVNLKTPATDLRVGLSQLLSEQAYLTVNLVRATAADAPDADAARRAVVDNRRQIEQAISGVYGGDAGQTFGRLWQTQVDRFADYATARSGGDTEGQQKALAALSDFRDELTTFLSGASPDLAPDSLAELLQLHIDQVTAYAEQDFEQAFTTEREAYAHMFQVGDALAVTIVRQFPEKFPGEDVAFSPAATLRLTLDRLLGEHLILAAEAMRAGATAGPDFEAAGGALRANSEDLAAAVASIYGADAGTAFGNLWGAHVDAYLDYITGVSEGDTEKVTAAEKTLQGYGKQFGAFIASANPSLPAAAVNDLITHHTKALVELVDAYQAKRYALAYGRVHEAYVHVFSVGDALATAIAAQFPDRFETPLPPTDTLTSPGRSGPSLPLLPLTLLVVGSLTWLAVRSPRAASARSPIPW